MPGLAPTLQLGTANLSQIGFSIFVDTVKACRHHFGAFVWNNLYLQLCSIAGFCGFPLAGNNSIGLGVNIFVTPSLTWSFQQVFTQQVAPQVSRFQGSTGIIYNNIKEHDATNLSAASVETHN